MQSSHEKRLSLPLLQVDKPCPFSLCAPPHGEKKRSGQKPLRDNKWIEKGFFSFGIHWSKKNDRYAYLRSSRTHWWRMGASFGWTLVWITLSNFPKRFRAAGQVWLLRILHNKRKTLIRLPYRWQMGTNVLPKNGPS